MQPLLPCKLGSVKGVLSLVVATMTDGTWFLLYLQVEWEDRRAVTSARTRETVCLTERASVGEFEREREKESES